MFALTTGAPVITAAGCVGRAQPVSDAQSDHDIRKCLTRRALPDMLQHRQRVRTAAVSSVRIRSRGGVSTRAAMPTTPPIASQGVRPSLSLPMRSPSSSTRSAGSCDVWQGSAVTRNPSSKGVQSRSSPYHNHRTAMTLRAIPEPEEFVNAAMEEAETLGRDAAADLQESAEQHLKQPPAEYHGGTYPVKEHELTNTPPFLYSAFLAASKGDSAPRCGPSLQVCLALPNFF